MEVVGDPDAEQPIFGEFREILRRREGERFTLASLERFAFYDRAEAAYAIVATGERRLYGNIILKKGVVRPEG
jgi:L-fucose mutarotase